MYYDHICIKRGACTPDLSLEPTEGSQQAWYRQEAEKAYDKFESEVEIKKLNKLYELKDEWREYFIAW